MLATDPAALGLAPGDLVRTIGGAPVESAAAGRAQLRRLLRARPETLLLEVERAGAIVVVRVVPSIQDGEPDGFKLYAMRRSSPFAALGFANGDTVHRINGEALTSMDRALEIYAKLRDATRLEVELTRRGRPTTLTIDIR